MVFDMRMTIHLPDELLITARQRAAEKGMTLRAIIERSLRREIRQPRAGRRAGRRRIRWVTVPGGLLEASTSPIAKICTHGLAAAADPLPVHDPL
jgi:hypothetical protein